MRVLVPAAGDSELFKATGNHYPQNLVEIDGSPLIQRVIEGLRPLLTDPGDLICVVRRSEDARFHTADVVRLLVPSARVVVVPDQTGGAACSALLAIAEIDTDSPLLVFNGDQVIDADLVAITGSFMDGGLEAGIIVFEAVHPRWSYVRCDEAGLVVEAAEKRPISTLATAGAYWYRRGGDFIDAVTEMIKKDAHLDGRYYICPSFNELVLRQARIGVHHIDRDQYLSLHTPQGVQAYEELLIAQRKGVRVVEILRLDDMVRGWFVGDFEPTLYRTTDVEVGVKEYVAGDAEARHYHKIATELTVMVSGEAEMDGRRIGPGEIVVLRPGESSDFLAVTDVTLVAVKLPGAKDDKYVVEEP